MDKLINKPAAKKALVKVERVASQLKPLIQNENAFELNYDRFHEILDEELKRDEYFVIVDTNGTVF